MGGFFRSIFRAVRGALVKMGFIRAVTDVFKLKNIPTLDGYYDNFISIWKYVYRGYFPQWHDVAYTTVEGMRRSRRMASMNGAKALCAELAGLTFNEKVTVTVSDGSADGGLQAYIDSVLDDNYFFGQMQGLIEQGYALGGAAVKVWFEGGRVRLDYVPADYFIPVAWDSKSVTSGIFIHKSAKENAFYTLLEWHLWEGASYIVRNALYKADSANILGVPVPLSALYPDMEQETRIEGLRRPLFVYFKPNVANNLADDTPLGISVFANALDTLKALDVCFDSFTREFVLGKKRIIVPATAVRQVVTPDGNFVRYFDASDEVYQAMPFEAADGARVIDNSVVLRVEEHISALNAFLSILALQTGLTPGTLAFTGAQGVKTATEVISENSKTFKTIKAHENLISEAIYGLIDIIVEVSQLYDVLPANLEYEKSVVFDDSIVQDKKADTALALQLVASGLRSKFTSLVKDFGFTEELAAQELARIQAENAPVTGAAVDLFANE